MELSEWNVRIQYNNNKLIFLWLISFQDHWMVKKKKFKKKKKKKKIIFLKIIFF